jgi:hypothetical protein
LIMVELEMVKACECTLSLREARLAPGRSPAASQKAWPHGEEAGELDEEEVDGEDEEGVDGEEEVGELDEEEVDREEEVGELDEAEVDGEEEEVRELDEEGVDGEEEVWELDEEEVDRGVVLIVGIVDSQGFVDVDGGGYGHGLEAGRVGIEGGHFDSDGQGPAVADPVVGPGGGDLRGKARGFEEEAAVG